MYLNHLHAQEAAGEREPGIETDPKPELKMGFNNLGFKNDFTLSPNGRPSTLSRQTSNASESDLRIRESDQSEEEHSPHRTSIYTRIGAVSEYLGRCVRWAHLITILQSGIQLTLELLSVWMFHYVRVLYSSVLTTSLSLVFFSARWLLVLLRQRKLGLALGLFPVILLLSATFRIE